MWSSSVKVHPWIGNNYKNPIHFKYNTLILGESNYTNLQEQFNPSLVIRCVEDDLTIREDTTGFCKFSTKTRRVIFGRNESIGPNEFWQDVAFYNFVQQRVGDRSHMRPTSEMWENSMPAFLEIVEKLKPSRVLVLGKANWNNLLQHIPNHSENQYIAKLTIGTNLITAGYINHPSSSLTYTTWQPIARQLLFS